MVTQTAETLEDIYQPRHPFTLDDVFTIAFNGVYMRSVNIVAYTLDDASLDAYLEDVYWAANGAVAALASLANNDSREDGAASAVKVCKQWMINELFRFPFYDRMGMHDLYAQRVRDYIEQMVFYRPEYRGWLTEYGIVFDQPNTRFKYPTKR